MSVSNVRVIFREGFSSCRLGEIMKNLIRIFALGVSLMFLYVSQVQAAVVNYTSLATFQANSGSLTLVNFDVDSGGNPIAAPSPGVLAGNNFSGYGITFNSGVVFGEPNLPFGGVSPPNIISNTQINTPTPALVDGVFAAPVFEVGLTNTGAEAILRIFDISDNLIGTINSDLDPSFNDFIGLISDTPIYRMEFDFVSGIGFGGDDLYFTQIASPIPLPAAAWLFGTALIGFVGYSRRRKIF